MNSQGSVGNRQNKGGRLLGKKLLILSIVCIVLAPVFVSAADTPSIGPQAFLPESVFEFHPVVENTRSEKGFYADALYIRTDSKIRPMIPIYITGMIQ